MAETIEETYESAVTRKVVRTSLKIEEGREPLWLLFATIKQ